MSQAWADGNGQAMAHGVVPFAFWFVVRGFNVEDRCEFPDENGITKCLPLIRWRILARCVPDGLGW